MPHNPPDDDSGAGDGDRPRGEAYVEFKQVGQAMKVSAVDAETGIEVVIMGPVTATRNDLQRVALRKLKAQVNKHKNDETSDLEDDDESDSPGPKGWIA